MTASDFESIASAAVQRWLSGRCFSLRDVQTEVRQEGLHEARIRRFET